VKEIIRESTDTNGNLALLEDVNGGLVFPNFGGIKFPTF
jgi:hypothetical protein